MQLIVTPDCPASSPIKRVRIEDQAPTGYLHSVESGAAADGPGIRFVFFMSGCPFRCVYCHNPDTWTFANGRAVSLDEAIAEVKPYASFLRHAGGVTVSGGEPLTQPNFVGRLMTRLHDELGLHTALDTQGFLGHKVSDEWLEAVDLVLLDVKHAEPEAYKRITGRALQPTLDFAERLTRLGKEIWIRYVLVPGLTDAPADVSRLADRLLPFAASIRRVEVLPYHRMGAHKWTDLGRDYPLAGTEPPTEKSVAAVIESLKARGLPAC